MSGCIIVEKLNILTGEVERFECASKRKAHGFKRQLKYECKDLENYKIEVRGK